MTTRGADTGIGVVERSEERISDYDFFRLSEL